MTPFRELLAEEGVEEVVDLSSRFGVMAFHGGSLEEGTDVLARRVAAASGASLYAVVQPPDLRWHVPSRLVTADASPALAAFLDHVEVAVALHGYGRDGLWSTVLLGGSNRPLAAQLAAALAVHLPNYDAVAELSSIPAALRGLHPDNPVNRARQGGVQVELPPRVRGLGPRGNQADTDGLVAALVSVARAWAVDAQ